MEEKSGIKPVKMIAGLLFNDEEALESAKLSLARKFSAIDIESHVKDFNFSDYYESEMGKGLKRVIVSFENLIQPDFLIQAKKDCVELENEFSQDSRRKVNIDPGYLDMFKLILASHKGRSNKIYLTENIWADMVLYFEKGEFRPFLWSFPDFKSGIFNEILNQMREKLKKQLKS